MECIVFKASAAYGQFRKPYTTTSALTFLTIHPVAVRGLGGAILGIQRTKLYEETKDMRVGVRVCNDVVKDVQSAKLLTMKTEALFNFPSNIEFLRNVEYELYIMWDTKHLNDLEFRLKTCSPVFTPCMGISEHIAKVRFVARLEVEEPRTTKSVSSVVPISTVCNLNFSECRYYIDEIPVRNNCDREYIKYSRIIFGFVDGVNSGIAVNFYENVYSIGDTNVYFF